MKKNKIIIPAMAMILFSTAASISGTVAWFTANRVFETDIGDFSVVEIDGSLDVTMAAGEGTVYDSGNNAISVRNASNPVVLTHGSVAHTGANQGHAFVVDPDSSVSSPSYIDMGIAAGTNKASDVWDYRDDVVLPNKDVLPNPTTTTVDVYVAVSWKMTFTYTFASDSSNIAVYLDTEKSTFSEVNLLEKKALDFTDTGTVDDADTARGFRVGFYGGKVTSTGNNPAVASHDVVWGNNIPTDAAVPGEWAKNHTGGYHADDKVLKDGVIYQAKHDIDEDTDWSKNNWDIVGDITLNKSAACDATYVAETNVAPAYSDKSTYAIGDVVTYSDAKYRCKSPIAVAEDWTAGHWDAIASYDATPKYTADDYIYPKKGARIENGKSLSTNYTQVPNRICVLTPTENSITITCSAWYEGTDPNIVSGAAMKCLQTHMVFYSRTLVA